MSTATVKKAQRLHESGAVTETPARVFQVQGDHGTYTVVIGQTAVCTCPASGPCAHIAAALLQIRDEENR